MVHLTRKNFRIATNMLTIEFGITIKYSEWDGGSTLYSFPVLSRMIKITKSHQIFYIRYQAVYTIYSEYM